MTRKDYRLIAAALHEALQHGGGPDELLGSFISRLQEDNPRFDRAKFRGAVLWNAVGQPCNSCKGGRDK